jgi:hypothetical protein
VRINAPINESQPIHPTQHLLGSALRDRAEEVRNRAEAMTDEKLRMQMMRVAESYQKMAVDLLDTAMKRSSR